MDSDRFDALSRRLSSRRTALTGLVGAVAALLGLAGPEEGSAHNPVSRCRKIKDAAARRRCLRNARRHNRTVHCKPRPLAVTCADGRCGPRRNNCRRLVTCPCPSGKLCLVNRTCSRFCGPPTFTCPPGCVCGVPPVETPATLHCVPNTISCPQLTQPCTSTTQCPFGQFCGSVGCPGSPSWCVPACPS